MTEPNVEQVRIFNSEVSTHYYLYVRPDRLFAFINFAVANRQPDYVASPMPGLSWSAFLGLDAIFAKRPKKFPAADILLWLQEQIKEKTNGVLVGTIEMERILELFSREYPPDVGEDA